MIAREEGWGPGVGESWVPRMAALAQTGLCCITVPYDVSCAASLSYTTRRSLPEIERANGTNWKD
jgi:hypothetical protein